MATNYICIFDVPIFVRFEALSRPASSEMHNKSQYFIFSILGLETVERDKDLPTLRQLSCESLVSVKENPSKNVFTISNF